MTETERIDKRLYNYLYGKEERANGREEFLDNWNYVLRHPGYQFEATEVSRNKENTGYILKGYTISELMLEDYNNADKKCYKKLINEIYGNKDIARFHRGGHSLLELSLTNPNIVLGPDQKRFAVEEALRQFGTTRGIIYDIVNNNFEYYNSGNKCNYIDEFRSSINHGKTTKDIRYYILKSNAWTKEEKKDLVNDFYENDFYYKQTLNSWEEDIINSFLNRGIKDGEDFFLDKDNLYTFTKEELVKLFGKDKADLLNDEISFTKMIHELRPVVEDKKYKTYTK